MKMWWRVAKVHNKLPWGFKSNMFWWGKGHDTTSHLPLTNTPSTNRELVHSPGKSDQEHLSCYWAIEIMAFALNAVMPTATSGQSLPADSSSFPSTWTQPALLHIRRKAHTGCKTKKLWLQELESSGCSQSVQSSLAVTEKELAIIK